MILMAAGEAQNFIAYGFAPASLVAPLGCVAVLINAVVAVCCLHEKFTLSCFVGMVIIVVSETK